MVRASNRIFHTGTIKKTITIKAAKEKIWKKISNIAGLPKWVIDVKKTVYLSRTKKGEIGRASCRERVYAPV